MTTTLEKNKAFVLEAFDTLFNKRDYAAAESFWSSNYIQHSAHIEPGREGLFRLVKGCRLSSNTKMDFLSQRATMSCFMGAFQAWDYRSAGLW